MLTPGQDHDLTCAQPLLENADPRALIGDKAYDADSLIDTLNKRAITFRFVIPRGGTGRQGRIGSLQLAIHSLTKFSIWADGGVC